VQTPRRIHIIACGVLAIDLQAVKDELGIDASMQCLPGGLHASPVDLRRRLQEQIDNASANQAADMLALGYGVCGLGSVGIHARHIPLAIPRVHDCIALFLGSDAAYKQQFAQCPGTYYVSAGWIEEKADPQTTGAAPVQCGPTCYQLHDLVDKYGEENAEAIRHFLTSWQRNYQRAAFIDTGVSKGKQRYADAAKRMAEAFGWQYEQLTGTGDLLRKLLTARRTTDEILIVPPHHVTAYDPVAKGLSAVPVWEAKLDPGHNRHTLVFDGEGEPSAVRVGLGIDAGGTYTDAALFDFERDQVLQKAKAPTTRWDFTIGINEALDPLDAEQLAKVELVCVSTTLATNAIVEDQGQPAGLLIMPPYGLFDPGDITYRPLEVIAGKHEINGKEIEPVDLDQVRRVAHEMVERHAVRAFAVCGFASHNNPSHELAVKEAIEQATGLTVTCGHEVSEGVNYRVRAVTAALNARIIPCLEAFIDDVGRSLRDRGIDAPLMVVKSDGSLMGLDHARRRPIETILSGPAASVAGARYLAGIDDALVVDMGGTTTDTARIASGKVRTQPQGANVGGWRTHVQALDMRTLGLGGDSLVGWDKRKLFIGPRRVGPLSRLADQQPRTGEALEWIDRHLDHFDASTLRMTLVSTNGHDGGDIPSLDPIERHVLDRLRQRPHCLHELAQHVTGDKWNPVPLQRLEDAHLIQRCGLTPTDLLHALGRFTLWNADAARRTCDMLAMLFDMKPPQFIEHVLEQVVRRLTVELLKKQLDEQVDPESLDRDPVCLALMDNLLAGGGDALDVNIKLHRPIVGIGAPVHYFLPDAARRLGTEAIIPPHADVANAVGAITSRVTVRRKVRISPNDLGRYALYGLPGAPTFGEFAEAHDYAVRELCQAARLEARDAGTSTTRVEVAVHDSVAPLAEGSQFFLGRTLEAHITGRPDLKRAVAP
jgi:N-methylhydantoinase A/oxoprolinase/acetone carboxylase beta subunit